MFMTIFEILVGLRYLEWFARGVGKLGCKLRYYEHKYLVFSSIPYSNGGHIHTI